MLRDIWVSSSAPTEILPRPKESLRSVILNRDPKGSRYSVMEANFLTGSHLKSDERELRAACQI